VSGKADVELQTRERVTGTCSAGDPRLVSRMWQVIGGRGGVEVMVLELCVVNCEARDAIRSGMS
jgi:hypothetical protein